ncbi:MAG: hypothetical protein WCK10_03135 [Candidatus Staskawiczbacteria bacterium]
MNKEKKKLIIWAGVLVLVLLMVLFVWILAPKQPEVKTEVNKALTQEEMNQIYKEMSSKASSTPPLTEKQMTDLKKEMQQSGVGQKAPLTDAEIGKILQEMKNK